MRFQLVINLYIESDIRIIAKIVIDRAVISVGQCKLIDRVIRIRTAQIVINIRPVVFE